VGGTKNAIVQGTKSVLRGKYTTSSHIAAAEEVNREKCFRGSCLPLGWTLVPLAFGYYVSQCSGFFPS